MLRAACLLSEHMLPQGNRKKQTNEEQKQSFQCYDAGIQSEKQGNSGRQGQALERRTRGSYPKRVFKQVTKYQDRHSRA
jgi:hypothetical protein